ncbi:methyl-accepting chemotaxis (MCP) signaling domain protein [Yersinia ruckeri]|uniref:methyl-accepting chemotaxis protein n=1 Tax=Yersinia ruckeri TaxID=29486 RepID=UPI0005ACC088|nr:methyl-accepting chemotaxis protein [Yersinia ruckeri]AJI94225.1 methyl-accepting chemotaxis (MCP) signaling domain protein [Yersinia ruckeri]MCW6567147.1 methyl-accepting chemotaxis protein [Yersinia ruckeri]
MAAISNIFGSFENVNVGKKLGLSFFIMLLLVSIIAGTGAYHFSAIEDRAYKVDLSYQINEEVNQAKYNRALYERSYNPQFMTTNAKHINNILTLLAQNESMNWDAENQKNINRISEVIKAYQLDQKDFLATVEKKDNVRKSWNISETQKYLNQLAQNFLNEGTDTNSRILLAEMNQKLMAVRYNARGLLLDRNKEAEASMITAIDVAQNAANAFLPVLSTEQQKLMLPVIDSLKAYKGNILAYLPAYEQEVAAGKHLENKAIELNSLISNLFAQELQGAHDEIDKAQMQMTLTAIIALLLGLLIAWRITRQITVPLRTTLAMAERIATGDLTSATTSSRTDELGLLMNAVARMNENLRGMIDEIRIGVSQVSHASGEIAAGNTDLSSRTEQQAAAVEETAASMEQLNATVKQNADNAHHANQLATEASDTAEQGGKLVNDVVRTMGDISSSSKRISEITSVINSIAFQTNILALNAAVEAARAGEQGRGFAVVASEVRNLAQRSAQAAKEIEGLIGESVSQVNKGTSLVQNAGQTMEDIVRSVTHVRDIMAEIASASDEQSRGITQVSQAISEMDSTTQQNAALVEESAAAADSLAEQAILLAQAVAVFRLSESTESTKATPTTKTTPPRMTAENVKLNQQDNWETF